MVGIQGQEQGTDNGDADQRMHTDQAEADEQCRNRGKEPVAKCYACKVEQLLIYLNNRGDADGEDSGSEEEDELADRGADAVGHKIVETGQAWPGAHQQDRSRGRDQADQQYHAHLREKVMTGDDCCRQ